MRRDLLRPLVPLARILFVAIFLFAAPGHFTRATVEHAASQGVPLAQLLVPASGIVAAIGGLSVTFGYQARVGAVLLALFLIPVTLTMHNFWALTDPAAAALQQIMFMKNTSILGAALLIVYFGAGPVSFDARAGGAPGRTRA